MNTHEIQVIFLYVETVWNINIVFKETATNEHIFVSWRYC